MRLVRKIVLWLLIFSVSLVAMLFVLAIVFEKDISRLFLKEINKNLLTSAKIEEINFSLLKRFPQASIELNELLISSADGFNTEGLNSYYNDTLLYAGRVVLSLKLSELLRKNYIVDKIDVQNGDISVFTNLGGESNTLIWEKKNKSDSSGISLELSNISFNNTNFLFYSAKSGFLIRTSLNNSNNKLILKDKKTSISSVSDISIINLSSADKIIIDKKDLHIDTEIEINNNLISLNNSTIQVSGISFLIKGVINNSLKTLDLHINSDKSNITDIISLLPSNLSSVVAKYELHGSSDISLSLHGPWGKGKGLLIDSRVKINEGGLKIPSLPAIITQLDTDLEISMDLNNFKESIKLKSDRIEASVNGSALKGSIVFENLNTPDLDIILSGELSLKDIVNMIKQDDITVSSGSVRMNARLSGRLKQKEKYSFKDFLELERSVNLCLKSISLESSSLKQKISDIKGNIMIADNIWLDGLSFSFLDQNIAMNGRLSGINEYLLKTGNQLEVTAGIWSDKLDLNIIKKLQEESSSRDKTKGKNDIRLHFNITLNCDSLIIGNLNTSLFNGSFAYAPGMLNVNSFNFIALGGKFAGNAGVIKLKDKAYATRGWFDLENINIKDAFSVFNNFNQDHIVSDNLAGSLDGTISISAVADSSFRLRKDDLSLSGNYTISDGQLINYEPVYKLSRFIDISELENIQFSKLENDIIINNNKLTIPKMEIESSAFNISVAGSHSFGGKYDYHIKVYLSEFLSHKERSENSKVTEFGVIEDDGLGRTSLFLKIEGDKSGSKVSHDMTALKSGITEDIAAEKQSLKSIMKEEYGWYENDTLPEIRKDDTRKFRIVWEETDSVRIDKTQSTEKKLPLFRLFKKKKKKSGIN